MEIHQIRYFQAVARHGNFSRAATVCNVSQPSLSQQILKLEAEVGHALFMRTRRGAVLTARGERLLPRAQALLNALQAIREEVCDGVGLPPRELAVGAIPTIAPYLLPGLIQSCLRTSPGLQVRVSEETTNALLQSLREGRVDVGLASPPFPGGRDLTVEVLMEDELLLTLPRRHPLSRLPVVGVADILHYPLILMNDAHCLSRQTLDVCHRTRNDPLVFVDSSQLETVLAMVETGLGITFTPRLAVPSFKHRRVTFRSISPRPATRQIALIHSSQRDLTGADAHFRTECLALVSGAGDGPRSPSS